MRGTVAQGMVPRQISPLVRLWTKATGRLATMTTGEYLTKHVHTPELRGVLTSQWGDYGLPPTHSTFGIHALIVDHYLHGAWFPDGGSARIARTFERGIERAGGVVRVAQDVQEILISDGKAIGVRVLDRRGPTDREVVHEAPVVISAVGAHNTYNHLVATTGPVGERARRVRERLASLPSGLSAVCLHLRLRDSARELGVAGENLWINTSYEHDDVTNDTHSLMRGEPASHVYLSFPSLKSGDDTIHTAEVMATVDPEPFTKWSSRPQGNRGAEYVNLKQAISAGLVAATERALPGFADSIAYAELSTPLSVEHFTSHPDGQFYGVAATPSRYVGGPLGPDTPFRGLLLAGEDASSPGIVGAMFGGVTAASRALGSSGYPRINAALRQEHVQPQSDAEPRGDKVRAAVVDKQRVAPQVWQVTFSLDKPLTSFAAGQYARIHVGNDEWRDYSIAGVDGKYVRFLISTATGGHGSAYFEAVQAPAATLIELPLGRYTLAESANRLVFVATGTGVAPFSAMFEQLDAADRLKDAALFVGSRTIEDDLTTALRCLPGTVVRCTTRQAPPAGGFAGRVTDALTEHDLDVDHTDFYVCGSSEMVSDVADLLQFRGATTVFTEPY